ncbi:MFS transporter [Shouchella lonarensis]|uniref:Predicted arabinose efflux permease, MFS family n=1 Tax=Shouchella lonarensis TaxID=1464122 RepID=A0A1G6N1L1_9BACI|nr:MFS transporter [Shouchella lonarensis]SDC61722.1 Predicted arabinose efflux permease, MFS family [Shouchella lonarensis]
MWSNKNFWLLMLGVLGAEFGMWFGIIGNLHFLKTNLESSFLQALVLLSGVVVGTLFGPLAGRLIDSYKKKNILVVASLCRIIAVSSMFLALNQNAIFWMVIYSMLMGVSAAFYFPTTQTLIPLIVDKAKLNIANVVQMNLVTLSRIFGAASAGLLLSFISLEYLYSIALSFYIVLLIASLALKVEEFHVNKGNVAEKSFKEIFPVINKNKSVLVILILSMVPYAFIAGFNIIVIEISALYKSDSISGLLYMTEGAFILIAGLLVARINKERKIVGWIILSCLVIVISQLLLASSDNFLIPYIAFGLFGLAAGIFIPISSTFYQKSLDSAFHGRFFSLKRILENVNAQISLLGIGLLLDLLGFHMAMLLFGCLSGVLVISCIIYLSGSADKKSSSSHLKGGENNEWI